MKTLVFRSGGRTTWRIEAEEGALSPFWGETGQPGLRPLIEAVELFDRATDVVECWDGHGAALPSSQRSLTPAERSSAREGVLAGLRAGFIPALV